MKQTIEETWKDGFADSDALVAPKLSDLYNLKSKHIIDKTQRMFKINLILIVAFSFLLLATSFVIGIPITGVSVFFLLNWLVIVGIKEMKTLEKIDKNTSSYEYIKSFDNWMKEKIVLYTRLYTYFYPLFFLSFVVGAWFSQYRESFLNELVGDYSGISMVGGVPVFILVPVLLITVLLTYFGGALYRFDLSLIYGDVIKRLNKIIADMEELRS